MPPAGENAENGVELGRRQSMIAGARPGLRMNGNGDPGAPGLDSRGCAAVARGDSAAAEKRTAGQDWPPATARAIAVPGWHTGKRRGGTRRRKKADSGENVRRTHRPEGVQEGAAPLMGPHAFGLTTSRAGPDTTTLLRLFVRLVAFPGHQEQA